MTPTPTVLARLVGGHHDGHTDRILAPPPALVCLHYCDDCQRVHLHAIDGVSEHPDVKVYALDAHTLGSMVLYRPYDLDAELDAITAEPVRLPATATAAARRWAVFAHAPTWPR